MSDRKSEDPWASVTWEGNRLRQHREFLALSFREKLRALEEMELLAERFRAGRARPPTNSVADEK